MDTAPPGVHAMIEHLIAVPQDRALIRTSPETLFERFGVPKDVWPVLRTGGRDDLAALRIQGNLVIKWLIWSGRPTVAVFPIRYYFDRR